MYGSYKNVLWETYNEPLQVSWSGTIKPYHQQIVPVIRQHSQTLISLGTKTWSQAVDEACSDRVSGDNLAYTIHFYPQIHKGEQRTECSEPGLCNLLLRVGHRLRLLGPWKCARV